MVTRFDPPGLDAERPMLLNFLNFYRDTLEWKAGGLTDAQARATPIAPSDLSIMGLIRHMAEVERNWFRRWMAGDATATPLYYDERDRDGDLHPGPNDTLAGSIAAWRAEIADANDITARFHSLDTPSRKISDREGEKGWQPNLRWVLIHMIEEYARHCGHADLIRQRIDGTVGD